MRAQVRAALKANRTPQTWNNGVWIIMFPSLNKYPNLLSPNSFPDGKTETNRDECKQVFIGGRRGLLNFISVMTVYLVPQSLGNGSESIHTKNNLNMPIRESSFLTSTAGL